MSGLTPELIKQAIAETREYGEAKCVQTRDGRQVRVWADDLCSAFNIVGSYWTTNGYVYGTWFNDGRFFSLGDDARDLVPVPVKRTLDCWIAISQEGFMAYRNQTEAKKQFAAKAVLHIVREYTEGEGL